ncbi:MAG: hypothetical protein IT560_10040 [Alphaproteobacteria bacterium]|nr:hypothetical protein [Alphaproteobacteria bacterium]
MPKAPTSPGFADQFKARIVGAIDAWQEERQQKKYGSHDTRKAEMLERLDDLPGGGALKETIARNDIPVDVRSKRKLKNAFGAVAKEQGRPTVNVEILNTGDPVGMARTTYHEFRHVLQMEDMGSIETGGARRIKDVRTAHMLSMMMEADAYTSEVLAACKAAKSGHPEYLDDLFNNRDGGPNAQHAKAFLQKQPFDSFKDDANFARALFTDFMLNGLDNYSTTYFGNYRMQFLLSPTLKDFRQHLADTPDAATVTPSKQLAEIYKQEFMDGVSVRAIAHAFRRNLPKEEQELLRIIDTTVSNADKYTEDQYQRKREDILMRANSIYMKEDFYMHPPGTAYNPVSRFLAEAARRDAPVTVGEFKSATVEKSPKPKRF